MTTLKITAGAFKESILIRCNLVEASSPVQVKYRPDDSDCDWESTQYQCADARHRESELAEIGALLLGKACECSTDDLADWTYEVLETIDERKDH